MTTNEASSPGGSAAAAAPAGPAAHSPRSGVPPSALQLQGAAAQLAAKQVADGRRKVLSQLEDVVLDYFHNNPIHIEACLSTCIKVRTCGHSRLRTLRSGLAKGMLRWSKETGRQKPHG